MKNYKNELVTACKKAEKIYSEERNLYIEGEHCQDLDNLLADLRKAADAMPDALVECLEAETAMEIMEKSGVALDVVRAIMTAAARIIAAEYSLVCSYATKRLVRILKEANDIFVTLYWIQMDFNIAAMIENRNW